MNTHKLTLKHTENLLFETEINGYPLIINGDKLDNGNPAGITPKKLLLAAITGCTAIDVKGLLEKMRVPFSDFSIEVEAPLNSEHPVVYTHFKLIYKIKVSDADKEKVEKAVKLSKEKYCGVSAMLGKAAPVEYEIEYV